MQSWSNLCSTCGRAVPENAAFCPTCGTIQSQTYGGATELSRPPTNYGGSPYQSNPYEALPPPPPPVPPRLTKRKRNLILLLVLAVCLIVALASIGIFGINAHNNQVAATATAQANVNRNTIATSVAGTATVLAYANATATATAAVTPTPTPNPNAPYGGTQIINDSLDSDSGLHWYSDPFYCHFSNGAFHVQSKESQFEICEPGSIQNLGNLAFEVKMTINKGNYGGIVFRFDHKQNSGYIFTVGSDGTCYLYLDQNGSSTSISEIVSPAVKKGLGQSNIIAAVAKGNTITLYVNGQSIDSVTDSTFSSGVIGVVAESQQGQGQADVAYNNVKVWKF